MVWKRWWKRYGRGEVTFPWQMERTEGISDFQKRACNQRKRRMVLGPNRPTVSLYLHPSYTIPEHHAVWVFASLTRFTFNRLFWSKLSSCRQMSNGARGKVTFMGFRDERRSAEDAFFYPWSLRVSLGRNSSYSYSFPGTLSSGR